MFDNELLKEVSLCKYTGIETNKTVQLFSGVFVYESKTQEHHNIRLVYKNNGIAVCGILLRRHNKSKFDDYVVSGIFTNEDKRLMGFAKSLKSVAKVYVRSEHKAKLCLDNNLTPLGKLMFKNGV